MIGLVLSATKKEVTRYNIWLVEDMARVLRVENELHGRKATCQTLLFDMEGFTLRQIFYKPGFIFFYTRVLMILKFWEKISPFLSLV